MNTPENSSPPPTQTIKPRWRWWDDLKALGVIALVLAAFIVGILAQRARTGDQAGPAVAAAGEVQKYTCPMHPEIINDGPGKCPICGMDLVPAAQDDDADLGPRQLTLSPRAVALLNVQTVPVQQRPAEMEVRLVGKVEVDETRLRTIAVRVPGRIERLMVDYTGTTVKAGEPMVELYSPELLSAQQELIQAAAAARRAPDQQMLQGLTRVTLEATREKLRLWGLTPQQIEQIERSGEVSERLTLTAPIGGVVIEKEAREGQYVEEGQRIYSIADLSELWVQFQAYESDLPWIREGATVTFTTQAAPGQRFEGTVAFVSPTVDDRTRTVRVRVHAPNEKGLLKPGMFVHGVLRSAAPDARPAMVIPASAPLITGRRAVVYVHLPDAERPTFEGRDVVLGPRMGDLFVVESGLAPGERVVTNGNFRLDAELQLRGRISMMAPEGGAAPAHDHAAHGGAGPAAAPATVPERIEAPAEFSQQVGAVVGANFGLVKALSDDDPQAAQLAARQARQALAAVDMGLVQGAAHDLWMGSQRRMDQALEQLAGRADLATQRRHFEQFSDELTRVVRWFGTGPVGPVYRAMCPMVENRRAYWLQADRPITNPYWGEAMYRCGEIVETLVEARP
jgi:membrane fusion protein, copper/silver efflux system